MNDFIIRKYQSTTLHIRSLYRTQEYLITVAIKSLIHAIVASHLDYVSNLMCTRSKDEQTSGDGFTKGLSLDLGLKVFVLK